MAWSFRVRYVVVGLALGWVLSACQTSPVAQKVEVGGVRAGVDKIGRISLDLPEAWGGDVRCGPSGCLLGAVEHERNAVVVHQFTRERTSQLLSAQAVRYHPDSAIWLTDDLLAAAVEDSAGVDVFRLTQNKLVKLATIPAGFGPRDVVLIESSGGHHQMLATPYIGSEVVWMDWQESAPGQAKIRRSRWCKSPWHPTKVSRVPKVQGGGVAVACLDDKRVIAVSSDNLMAAPLVLATFSAVPRQVRPSPSGQWLYVALETGGRNARIDMETGELQWIEASPMGAVSVALLADDLVVWGEDSRLRLQRIDAKGAVVETRELATSGFSTGLQLVDLDGDQELDLMVLNSSGKRADVIYGPLWDAAAQRP